MWNSPFSGDATKSLHRPTICGRSRWGCIFCRLQWNNSGNLQFSCPIHLTSLTKVVGHISPAWVNQFICIHLLLPKMLHLILYCIGFVCITQLGSWSLRSLYWWGSSELSCLLSPSSPSLELVKSFRLSLIVFTISSNVVSGFVVVIPMFLAFPISSFSWVIAVSAS